MTEYLQKVEVNEIVVAINAALIEKGSKTYVINSDIELIRQHVRNEASRDITYDDINNSLKDGSLRLIVTCNIKQDNSTPMMEVVRVEVRFPKLTNRPRWAKLVSSI